MESVFILWPEGRSLALRPQAAVSDDPFRTHLTRDQFHATHAHHADIAHTQNSHRVPSRPPACSHSETNRPAPTSTNPAFPDLHFSFNLISRAEFLAWFLTGE